MAQNQSPVQQGQAAALPKTYGQHPLSAAFPAMTAEEFQELKDSIEAIGVQNPITVADGMVIDGWHRYNACTQLGMDCPVVELAPGIDPRDFVMAQNQARRHVTKAQMAMAVTAVYAWKPVGNPTFSQLDTECPIAENTTLPSKTTAELSEISGVHANTIKQAKTVTAQAAPAVVEAVKRGELGLPKAAAIAKLPHDQQAQAISKPLPRPPVVAAPRTQAQPDPWANPEKGSDTIPKDAPEDDFDISEEEKAEALAEEKADREMLEKMLAADDQMAMLYAETKKLKALVLHMENRHNALMNKAHAAEQMAKKFEAQNRRLLKQLEALKKGGSK